MAESEGEANVEDVYRHVQSLADLSPGSEEYTQAAVQLMKDKSLLDRLRTLLSASDGHTESAAAAAQLIAELAKAETARTLLFDEEFIDLVVPLISSEDKELCLQCVRALGNLCYEQDRCREKIVEVKGLELMAPLLQFCIRQHTTHGKLKTACCGFLHNLINGNELCGKAVLATDIVDAIKHMLERNVACEPIANFCQMIFTSLAEVEGGREAMLKLGVVPVLLRIFVNTNVADTDDSLLTLLSTMAADFDEVKKMFAESSLDMHLLKIVSLLSSKTDEESQQLVKAASELLVLVLTGDEAMNVWFDGGDGYVFASISEWLQSSNGQLLQSAAFAIGNFARGERNSRIIIDRGISLELYKALGQLRDVSDDARTGPTIHAILSALRNMAIAPSNKDQLLEQGILSHLLPYIKSESSIITSKLVGVLRLLIDGHGEESELLGKNTDVVQSLVQFAKSDTNALLKGESMRCLAWIIKGCRNAEAYENILRLGGFEHIVTLVASEHVIMQMEGVISVVMLAKVLPEGTKMAVKESKLVQTLVDMLNKEGNLAKELLANILLLIIELINIGLKEVLVENKLQSCMQSLSSKTNDQQAGELIVHIQRSVEP